MQRRLSPDRPMTDTNGSPGPNVSPTHRPSLDRPSSRVRRRPRIATATAAPVRGASPPRRVALASPSTDRPYAGHHLSRGPPLAASSLDFSPPRRSRHPLRVSVAGTVSPSAPPLPPSLASVEVPTAKTAPAGSATGGARRITTSHMPSAADVQSADIQSLVDSRVTRAMRGGGAAEDAVAAVLAEGIPVQQRHLDRWGLGLTSPGPGRPGVRVVRAAHPQRASNGAVTGRAGSRDLHSRDTRTAGTNGMEEVADPGRAKPRRHAPSSADGAIAPARSMKRMEGSADTAPPSAAAGGTAAGGAPSDDLAPRTWSSQGSADDDMDMGGFANPSPGDGGDGELFSPSPPPLPATPSVRQAGVASRSEQSGKEAPAGARSADRGAPTEPSDASGPASDAVSRPHAEPLTPSMATARRVVVRSVVSPSPPPSVQRPALSTRSLGEDAPATEGGSQAWDTPALPGPLATSTPAPASGPGQGQRPRRVSVSRSPEMPIRGAAPQRVAQPDQSQAGRAQCSSAQQRHDGFEAFAGSARAAAGAGLTASRLEQTLLRGGSALLGQRSAVHIKRAPGPEQVGAGGPGGRVSGGSRAGRFGAQSLA